MNNRKNKRRFNQVIVYILLLAIIFLTACGSQGTRQSTELRTVKIGYLPITHAAPLYIEHQHAELGEITFGNFKLELVKFGSWPDLMDALNTGQIDGASVLVQLAMAAKEQGIDLKAVALGHRDGNVVVTAPDINEVADLQGQPFAIPHKFSTHHILMYQMLKQEGFEYEDVDVIELPPAEMPAALAEGRIAGYAVAEPFGAMSVALGTGKVLFQSPELWEHSICCVLVLRGEFINEERELAEELVKEYLYAGELAEARNAEIQDILANYMAVDEEVLSLSLEWIVYDDLTLDEASYEELRNYMLEMGLSENPPTYDEFVEQTLW